jgi:Zn-dependent peptidase ImmA (M78 family)
MENEEIKLKPNVGGARNIARRLLKDSKVKEIPVSLPKIINYLKSQHDLAVWKVPLGKVDGLLVMVDGHPTIGFNADQSWVRKRLTIAHEIGHLLMGHTCGGAGIHDNAETEAYQFAAELLMPLAYIRKDFVLTPNAEQLARKYIVSKEALCIHLIECKIL